MTNYKYLMLAGIVKTGINQFIGLDQYMNDAMYFSRNGKLISNVPRDENITFHSYNHQQDKWNIYEAVLEDNLKYFDISLKGKYTKRQIGKVRVSDVLDKNKMEKYGLPLPKAIKSTPKSTPKKSKSNTRKSTKRTSKKRSRSSSRIRKGHKAKKSRSRKAKK